VRRPAHGPVMIGVQVLQLTEKTYIALDNQ
jgi:hypothetical protein